MSDKRIWMIYDANGYTGRLVARGGGRVRADGAIVAVPLAYRMRVIDLGTGPRSAVTIPWGDAATEYFTTGIPNVEVYVPASRTARLTTSNGYRLTVDGALMAVRTLLAREPAGGYFTPPQLMGPRCVERLPGSSAIRIE